MSQKLYAALQEKKKMDPVGKADADIDNDGDVDDSDEYLHNRRKAIKKAMAKEEVELQALLDEMYELEDTLEELDEEEQLDELIGTIKKGIKKVGDKIASMRGKDKDDKKPSGPNADKGLGGVTDEMLKRNTYLRYNKKQLAPMIQQAIKDQRELDFMKIGSMQHKRQTGRWLPGHSPEDYEKKKRKIYNKAKKLKAALDAAEARERQAKQAKESYDLGEAAKMSANSETWYRKGYEMGKDPSTYKNPPYGIGGAAMDAFRKGRKAGEAARNKNEGSCGTMNASTLKAMALKKSMQKEDLQEKLGDDTPLTRKGADGKHQLMHKDRSMMSAIRKGMSDHEKKHMGGAYRDDTDIVHRATGKTMTSLHGKTVDQARKEIQAHIAKHHPETEKSEKPKMGSVQTVSSTRKIYTVANDSDVERIKDKYKRMGDGKYTVRPMKRKEGFKVYVDRKS